MSQEDTGGRYNHDGAKQPNKMETSILNNIHSQKYSASNEIQDADDPEAHNPLINIAEQNMDYGGGRGGVTVSQPAIYSRIRKLDNVGKAVPASRQPTRSAIYNKMYNSN